MDDTLIHCNAETDKQNCYLLLNVEKELPLMEYFRALRNAGEFVYILTTRHPDVKPQIANYFTIPQDFIFCRDFVLGTREILDIIASEEKTKVFNMEMVAYKSLVLEAFAKRFEQVYFFDDCYAQFTITNRRIRVMPPALPVA